MLTGTTRVRQLEWNRSNLIFSKILGLSPLHNTEHETKWVSVVVYTVKPGEAQRMGKNEMVKRETYSKNEHFPTSSRQCRSTSLKVLIHHRGTVEAMTSKRGG